jgi:hypothetical protein
VSGQFYLDRTEDVSGTSGIGRVAHGFVFDDGTAVLRWLTDHTSTAIYASLDEVEAIHGHDGRTKVVREADRSLLLDAALRGLGYQINGEWCWCNLPGARRFDFHWDRCDEARAALAATDVRGALAGALNFVNGTGATRTAVFEPEADAILAALAAKGAVEPPFDSGVEG